MTDSSSYTDEQRALQDQFGSRALADRLEDAIIATELDEHQQRFVTSRDFFFLSTVNAAGEPTVSYKGGGRGLVSVIDPSTLAFPFYDGNGMFLSAGNVSATGKVGLLFIDFETPQRLRVQGTATIAADDELLDVYPGALLVCRVAITSAFVNCARYIHKHTRVQDSPYVPDARGEQPVASWKRIDGMQDVISDADRAKVADAGGTITEREYGTRLLAGES